MKFDPMTAGSVRQIIHQGRPRWQFRCPQCGRWWLIDIYQLLGVHGLMCSRDCGFEARWRLAWRPDAIPTKQLVL